VSSLLSYILTISPSILIVNDNIFMTQGRRMDSQLFAGFMPQGSLSKEIGEINGK